MLDVELSVTVWERTWRETLTSDFFHSISDSIGDAVKYKAVVINNVSEIDSVSRRAERLVRDRVIDSFSIVADRIHDALRATGLTMRRLQPLEHYSDHFLVKINDCRHRWLLHWDTDVRLVKSGDWVTPTIDLMQERRDLAVGGPAWNDGISLAAEVSESVGQHVLGYGFTDQIFLIEPSRYRAPIYTKICPASWWYPTSHIAPIFEQRVDAWMRRSLLRRATYCPVVYEHAESMADHPSTRLSEKVKRRTQNAIYEGLQRAPLSAPYLHRT